MKKWLILLFIGQMVFVKAQILVQNVRGIVQENNNLLAVNNARITAKWTGGQDSVETDSLGWFLIKNVPVGRLEISINADGYMHKSMSQLYVGAGKELVLQIMLEPNIVRMQAVQINVRKTAKHQTINDMNTVSGRQLSAEESTLYAGAINDPARAAMGFAGVLAADDGLNVIVVRGNNPSGLIWRMEGMDIPSPNHFGSIGSSGGGVSILSAQLMANSDFFTGAFAAEYGNGTAGVFDLHLRKGNRHKREYTAQAGVLGLDFAAEGPLGKKGGSFLINYRYSTLSILGIIGVPLGDGITNFQDLSYTIFLPINTKLNYSFFGFSGLSNQYQNALKDSMVWKTNKSKQEDWRFVSNTIFVGNKFVYSASKKHLVEAKLGVSFYNNDFDGSRMNLEYQLKPEYKEQLKNYNYSLNLTSNYKPIPKWTIKTGLILDNKTMDLQLKLPDDNDVYTTFQSQKANGNLLRFYTQNKYQISRKLSVNAGINSMLFLHNKQKTLEPRLGIRYAMAPKTTIALAYGMHSQLLPLNTYYIMNKLGVQYNKNLPMSSAQHYVIALEQRLGKSAFAKIETYYQNLSKQAVSNRRNNTYSLINYSSGLITDTFYSIGTGQNYGVELTYEKYLSQGYYVLFNTSISNSSYTDIKNRKHNTQYNVGKVINLSAGKEWQIKQNTLGLGTKLLFTGGQRYTPIDPAASNAQQTEVRDFTKPYQAQVPNYFRADIKVYYTINKRKTTRTWSLDIQNVSNRKNPGGQSYSVEKQDITYWYLTPLIPILSYKIQF